mmetsp:Transcript_31623/g.73783  ORF Transcript_31623/g.73783 Transcript_31623/m.73783 type:complete len:446 (-) Transcript_31623:129-1466(-)|eukprot:CAMPEP_0178432064 /NCGR_PEP_ID=MMETSP0689_2-20121128/32185_1 /TAXON_ID=160604 /ORGANISM="Amphidinium massartii, Strain CS-259" /LENGTH=445 /DNA_ID=CAMNT_0020054025 /DNA_START=43 /DNA_END=1380 /DNA_ORIENTATION=+
MPKQEVGSTKWLGNKMKAKGLQKLRWYCQMCQKQCRDENGFKCHRMSDGHQRQMQLFVQDPNRFMDEFSQEFEQGFMQLMSHSYRSQRVLANTVYCDFISNRHHMHMNATIWVTLSNFVQYLGRTGQCKIDKTPKGWYLSYIDNSAEKRMEEAAKIDRQRAEMGEEERHAALLAAQVEEGKALGGFQEAEFTELQREEGDAPIAFSFGGSSSSGAQPSMGEGTAAAASSSGVAASASARASSNEKKNVLEDAFEAKKVDRSRSPRGGEARKEKAPEGRKLSAMESLKLEHEASKKKREEQEAMKAAKKDAQSKSSSLAAAATAKALEQDEATPWISPGLVVKVMHQELADGKFYRKKGTIEKVHKGFTAEVRMQESRSLIKVDQEMLETVIPNIGKPVRVIKGTYKGWRATMRAVDIEHFCVTVELEDGKEMDGLGYDEICKFDS